MIVVLIAILLGIHINYIILFYGTVFGLIEYYIHFHIIHSCTEHACITGIGVHYIYIGGPHS